MFSHRKNTAKPLKRVFHINFDFESWNFCSKLTVKPWISPETGNSWDKVDIFFLSYFFFYLEIKYLFFAVVRVRGCGMRTRIPQICGQFPRTEYIFFSKCIKITHAKFQLSNLRNKWFRSVQSLLFLQSVPKTRKNRDVE